MTNIHRSLRPYIDNTESLYKIEIIFQEVFSMKTNSVNVAFNKDLLSKIDQIATEESRSRSELIREAARLYIERKSNWKKIFNFGKQQVLKLGLSERDIDSEITKYRKTKATNL
jgi:metal-responsive CopG/Arc/MetJ family transcriptional regulator